MTGRMGVEFTEKKESMKKSIWVLGIMGLLGTFLSGQAGGAIPISACGTVMTFSESYYLTNDILNCYPSSGPAAAITIQADNVTLDLHGHTVSGRGSPKGYGIYINGARNVWVHNEVIKNFGHGVLILSESSVNPVRHPDSVPIENNRIENNMRGIFGNRVGTLTNFYIRNNRFSFNN